MEEKPIGTYRGQAVTFDGITVRVSSQKHGITHDYELNGSFRLWLARRGVVLP